MAELAWPEDLGHGTFVGRFGFMDADSHDPDREPDITSATGGTVTITPSIKSVRYTGAQGPMILAARPATGVIDSEGYLCTAAEYGRAGDRGMVFPATDDADLNPTDWTYEVSIILDGQVRIGTFNVKLPEGETVDLSLAAPVSSSGGTATVVDPTTAIRAEAAADRAETAATEAEGYAPTFEWDGTSLIIDGGDPVDLKGEKGDPSDDRGRARTLADDPDNGFASADDITTPGRWQVWTAADATALGFPNNVAGSLDVYAFGNVVEQVYRQHYSAGIIEIGRRKAGTTWGAWRTMTVDDTSVAALITPGTETEAAIKSLIPDPDQGGEKTAAVALSSGDGGTKAVITDQSFRYPFKVGAPVKRWRVHIQNVATRYGSRLTGALAFKGLGFSRDAGETVGPDMEGRLSGSTWQQITGPFDTNAWGWEYVSPWVETPLEAGARYLLSGGFTGGAGQEVYTGVGGAWTTPNSDDWDVSSPGAGMSLTQAGPLFVWLEVVIDARTPVIGVFGDSLGQGHSARLPVYDGIGNRHSWAHGHIVTLYTNSGITMNDHLDETHYRWHRYDTANPAKLDGMIFEMGSNDIFGGAGLTLLKERYETCQDIITRNFTPRIVGMTVLPRHDPMDPSETTRQAFNEWLLTEKAGDLVAVADAAAPLADPAESRQIDKRWTASPSDIHLTAAGYARFMQGLPSMHT